MRQNTVCIFAELDVSALRDCFVALDIDGCLGPHGCKEAAPSVLRQIETLVAQGNRVRLVSNNSDADRTKQFARYLGVEAAETPYRKPDPRALGDVSEELQKRPLVVIGDKVLTDGLFARRLRATFIKVKIVRSPQDTWSTCSHYVLDWFARPFFGYR